MVAADCEKILIRRHALGACELTRAVAETSAVRQRIGIQKWFDRGNNGNRLSLPRQKALARVRVGHLVSLRQAEPFAQSFIAAKEKCTVFADGAAECKSKLVPLVGRRRCAIEKIARIQFVIPQKFKDGTMQAIAARFRDGVENSACVLAELS